MSKERRNHTRVPFRTTAEVRIRDRVYRADALENLSLGGCLLRISGDFQVNDRCLVKIRLNGTLDERSVSVEGYVLRGDSGLLALRFTHVDPDSLYHLKGIIIYNAPDAEAAEAEIARHPTPMG